MRILVSRRIFILVLTLSALITSNVCARELSDKALVKIPPQVLEQFLYSGERDLIILFDGADLSRQAHLKKNESGLHFENQAILRTKIQGFGDIKKSVLMNFDQGEIQQLYTYETLPMMFARVNTPQALYRLLENDLVIQVFENSVHSLSLQESLPLIGQVESYVAGHGGKGTTVAVVDTGVDYKRAAFGPCVSPGVPDGCGVVFAKDFTQDDDGDLDMNGHGTNVAGIVLGVAPETRIAALDVFEGTVVSAADAIAAIDWVIANQAVYNIVAMNLSFGKALYDQICRASWATTPFANARAIGVVPIVAAGNNFQAAKVTEPACAPGAVRVGAVHDHKPLGSSDFRSCSSTRIETDIVACFSNSASFLDLLAPGVEITAAGITKSGTSMATPHVAGAYAVLKGESAYPGESIESTIERLKSTGKQVLDDRNGMMFPRIDLEAALFELLPDQVPEISHFEPELATEGQLMKIHGSGFRGVDEVIIGGTPAHHFTVNTSQLITVNIGPGSSGEVLVVTSLGSDSLPGFTYINSIRETEPNNALAQANPVMVSGDRLSGNLFDQDDVDFFRFGLDKGKVSFAIEPVRRVCCSKFIQLTLQDGLGHVLARVQVDEDVAEPVVMQATIDQRGAYYLVVSETPRGDPVFDQDYQITVPENAFLNREPDFISTPPDVVMMGQSYAYPLQATDPDGDAVYFSILAGPSGMILDRQSNTLTWQPNADQAGFSDVELSVIDDFGGRNIQMFKISVIDSSLLGVNATDGFFENHVRVSFNPIEGATAYRVFRCMDAGESCGSPIGFTSKGVFKDIRAVPGTVYHYRVRACTSATCSPLSAADTGFAGVAPARPSGIRATDGTFTDRVTVTFDPAEGAVLYRIFRCLDKGQTCGTPIGFPPGTSFDDLKGDPGRVYYYRAKACSSQHCSKFSVANTGYSISESNVLMEIPETRQVKPIPVLTEAGRWVMFLLMLGLGFIAGHRAYRAGKLD